MAVGVAAYGVGKSIYDTIQEGKNKRDAAKALRNLEVPELNNAADSLSVSTLGADYKRELVSQNAATSVDALRNSGTRGIVGGVGRIVAGVDNASTEIAADLDQQQKNIDMFRAQDEENLRGIREGRFNADKAALSSQYNAANDAQKQAGANIFQAGAYYANGLPASTPTYREPLTSANTMIPANGTYNNYPSAPIPYGYGGNRMFRPSQYSTY